MSYYLWRYFFEDDVESFRRVLAESSLSSSTHTQRGAYSGVKIGSPGATFSTSPKLTSKSRRTSGWGSSTASGDKGRNDGATLTRGDVNRRDNFGRTILHHAASSTKPSAREFVSALLEISFLDLYVQDLESGWTALHRALYFGNISIAHELMARDIRDATDYTTGGIKNHAGGLIKIKDHEGNSPFDVYGTTVASRRLSHPSQILEIYGDEGDGVSVPGSVSDGDDGDHSHFSNIRENSKLEGDEVFTFGSNKNFNLGLGDEDDRQYPERISLQRPAHLLQRFRREWISARSARFGSENLETSDFRSNIGEEISFLALHPPMAVHDVAMSKLHTAIITSDPECNLFVCGFGPGGRLGTGDESTRFNFVCIDPPCLIGKRIASVALGQDHTIAVSDAGEVFTWGSNKFGQLGYNLPKTSSKTENTVQLLPRQVYGPLKKETILGAAASSIHSVLFTSTSLYAFGKNEGQLGLVDSDARSLEFQVAPRKVAASLFSSSLVQVSAIDRATICMLESGEVWVFTHFGYAKLIFPLDGFRNYFLQTAMPPTRYDSAVNYISKISSGGNTVCAMSSFGEVYTVQVSQAPEPGSATVSTTNPGKIRNSLPQPSRVWSIGKPHMAAKDVDVGQDGSIIICTEAGSVWKKEKRAKIKTDSAAGVVVGRPKDYKFVRIPSLTKAVAVRSNTFGAYAAVRKDFDVTRNQILTDHPLLWEDLFKPLPFRNLRIADEDSDAEDPRLRFWAPAFVGASPSTVKEAILASSHIEADIKESLERSISRGESSYDVWLKTTLSDIRIPIHEYVLASRSAVMRDALQEFRHNYYVEISEVLSIEYDKDGQIQIQFHGLDFLSIVNLVFYIYTDNVVDARFHTGRSSKQVAKYKQIRSEVMKLAASLEMRNLERSARVMVDPARCLHMDMEQAIEDPSFFECGDVLVDLNGSQAKVHSALMSIRCPFFEGLFNGRAGGQWLSERRDMRQDQSELVKVDLKHVDPATFHLVLKHLYADIGDDLFDDVVASNLDDFLDVVIDVISVANELMIDRLSQICQKLLGRFGIFIFIRTLGHD
jgi:inhibitor of Bruton tyrosine kinase